MKNTTILVIGAGSIGERHIRNLWSLGYQNIIVFRQRNLPFRDIGEAKVTVLLNWEEVIAAKPFAAFITSPTAQHLNQAIACAKIGCHLLIEKPLSHQTNDVNTFIALVKEKNIYVRVAYMMRFHPLVKQIKTWIENNTYGNLISITDKWGDYLPDWHPWEDYKESYAAKKELGGGVALTLSHDVDLVNWLISNPIKTFAVLKNYRNNLNINVEAGCDIILNYQNGVSGNIHLNYYEKTPERYLKLVFDEASVSFEYFKNTLTVKLPNQKEEIIMANQFDRNDMFLDQTAYFFQKTLNYTLEESIEQIEESIQIINICNYE